MANMYNINGLSYTAQENPEWFTRAMFGGRLVQGGYIRVLTGIKGDELLSMIDLENKILQIDGKDCAWTPNQIIKLSEKTAKVKTYKINLEQCIDELENKRTLYQLSPGAKNESLPPELEEATLYLIAIGLSNEIEEMIVGGDESVDPNQFNGMEKTLLDSTQAAKLVGTALTKANILQTIESLYGAVSEDVLQSEDAGTLYIFGSYGARRILRAALADKNNQVLAEAWTVDDTDKRNPRMYYLGVEFVPVKGIGKNTLICIDGTNAFLLTDLLSDLDEIEMGQFPKPNDNKIWIKGRLRLGFVIPFEDEAVIWSDKITTAQEAGPRNDDLAVVPNSLVFRAAGESKAFNIITKEGVTPEIGGTATGFTVTKGETTAVNGVNITPVTIVAADNTGNRDPKVGEVDVKLPDSDRGATVTLNQRNEDVDTVTQ
ncbi:hypothetical protein SAMN05444350_1445 [Bacteroides stercorirosoris]|uniref:Major capsid protein n=2 Tax=Bacteroides stercorirosoris TaxID=871324 RepID=A0A1M6L3S1_9BACE|nr:hypothetical protein SAMN05444350_1445 [Bacteroides stercorirosoris]